MDVNVVIKEEIVNFKSSLKKILNSNEAYEVLDNSKAGESTWCAGGCAILAYALNTLYGFPVYVIYDYNNNQIDHFMVKGNNNTFIDCDGEQKNILHNFKRKENLSNKKMGILKYSENLKNNGIPIDMEASQKLVELIKNSR
jgi:hypothetical protein